ARGTVRATRRSAACRGPASSHRVRVDSGVAPPALGRPPRCPGRSPAAGQSPAATASRPDAAAESQPTAPPVALLPPGSSSRTRLLGASRWPTFQSVLLAYFLLGADTQQVGFASAGVAPVASPGRSARPASRRRRRAPRAARR